MGWVRGWGMVSFSSEGKQAWQEDGHLTPSNIEVENRWSLTSTMLCTFMACTGTSLRHWKVPSWPKRAVFVLQDVKARAAESVPQQGGHYESELEFQLFQFEFWALVESFLQLLLPQWVFAIGEYWTYINVVSGPRFETVARSLQVVTLWKWL